MARISGIDLPRDKRIEVALTYIYGIGPARAAKVLEMTQIDPDIRVKDLTEDQEAQLRDAIEHNFTIEGDLRRETAMNIKRLKSAATVVCVTAVACPFMASVPRPMLVPVRARRRPSLTRRSKEGYVQWLRLLRKLLSAVRSVK